MSRMPRVPVPGRRPLVLLAVVLLAVLAVMTGPAAAASVLASATASSASPLAVTPTPAPGPAQPLPVVPPAVPAPAAEQSDGPSGNPLLRGLGLTGASGVPLENYELSIDGGGITDPTQAVSAMSLRLLWDLYRITIGLAAWTYQTTTGFEWMEPIVDPFITSATAVREVVADIGLIPLLLTVAAFVTGLWLVRGRWATGLTELLISCALAALAVGVLSNPVAVVAGQDGLLPQTQRFGTELSTVIATGGAPRSSTSEELRAETAGVIVDAFVRTPHQLLNYGAVLDVQDPGCAAVLDEALQEGPWGLDATVRERVGDCESTYRETADNPGPTTVATMVVLLPGAAVLALMMLVLSLGLLVSTVVVLLESVRLVLSLVLGIVPGSGRGNLMSSVSSIAVALVMTVGTLALAAVFVLVVTSLLAASSDFADPAVTFIMVTLFVTVALVVLVAFRARARSMAQRLSQRLAALSPGSQRAGEPAAWRGAAVVSAISNAPDVARRMSSNRAAGKRRAEAKKATAKRVAATKRSGAGKDTTAPADLSTSSTSTSTSTSTGGRSKSTGSGSVSTGDRTDGNGRLIPGVGGATPRRTPGNKTRGPATAVGGVLTAVRTRAAAAVAGGPAAAAIIASRSAGAPHRALARRRAAAKSQLHSAASAGKAASTGRAPRGNVRPGQGTMKSGRLAGTGSAVRSRLDPAARTQGLAPPPASLTSRAGTASTASTSAAEPAAARASSVPLPLISHWPEDGQSARPINDPATNAGAGRTLRPGRRAGVAGQRQDLRRRARAWEQDRSEQDREGRGKSQDGRSRGAPGRPGPGKRLGGAS